MWLHYIKVVRSALTQTVLPLINQPEMISYLKLCLWNIHGYKSRQRGNKLHKGAVLINGDFNARIGSQNDTISPNKFDIELGIEIDGNGPKRNSQDKITNKRGEELLDMCKSLDLFIVNGRKTGDPFGNYTCLKWIGNSVVDYLLVSKNILDQVPIFKVGQFQPMLSDHCPLFYSLEIPKNLHKRRHPLKKCAAQFLMV